MNNPNEAGDIAEAIDRIARVIRAGRFNGGLNPAQWEALRYLGRCNRFSNTPTALAAFLGATKGTVSQTVSALARKGLVGKRRRADRTPERLLALELTQSGEDLLARDPISDIEAAAVTLGRDAKQLSAQLSALLDELRVMGGRPSFGACPTCRHFQASAGDGDIHRCALMEEQVAPDESERICVKHAAA